MVKPRDNGNKVPVNVRLPRPILKKLDVIAKRESRTRTAQIEYFLNRCVEAA